MLIGSIINYLFTPLVNYTNLQLIKGCVNSNFKMQRALYDKYKVPLYMLCLRYARSREEAEDMLQEGFISIYRDIRQYDFNKGELLPWLRKIMLNAALQFIRKHRVLFRVVGLETASNQYVTNDDVFAKMSANELIQLIQDLPAGYQIIFNLYVLEGYKHKEIAKMLAISVNTSKSQLHKAKAMLRNKVRSFRMIPISSGQKFLRQ